MCFEVILPVIIASFSVFGVYAFVAFIGETWFGSDNISVCIEVDTHEVADCLDIYLKEARRKPMSHSGGITVLVRREFATEAFLCKLARRRIRHYVIDVEKRVDK